MSKKISKTPPPIFFILLLGLGIFGWSKLSSLDSGDNTNIVSEVTSKLPVVSVADSSILQNFSLGEKILINANSTAAKRNGVEAYGEQNYNRAANYFQQFLAKYPNDPEALIYLNNALVASQQPVKIAVAVPIGSNLDVTQEMLRGVAQAQAEFNEQGGNLQVQIIDDKNDADLSRQVAREVVKDDSILAVVGSNASNASLAAAKVYQRAGIVMITPTSTSEMLSNYGRYIFRAAPTNQEMATILAEHIINTARRKNVAICYDSQAPDNVTFKDAFVTALSAKKGKYINTLCDFAAPDFNAENSVSSLISSGAEAVLLAPHIDKLNRPIEFARANQWKMVLLGSFSLNTTKITQTGQGDLNGVVLPVPFHDRQDSAQDFTGKAKQIWGQDVVLTWRTATSYDAAKAITTALTNNRTRQEIQRQLRQDDFAIAGANGTIKFLPSGDRSLKPALVKVKANPERGYYFELLSSE